MAKPLSLPRNGEPSSSLPRTELDNEPRSSNWQAAVDYFKREIHPDHADIPIILCCVVAGLCDSSAYNAYSCFVSMQTGNTIFLALGASGLPLSKPFGWLKSLVSISSFLLGCYIFSTTRFIGPKARGTLSTSFFIQAIFIILAAALVQGKVVPGTNEVTINNISTQGVDLRSLLPLGFLAFQSGGQIVTSRILGYNEVPTTVLTSVYCDIASDPNLLVKDNVKRNRRICAVVFILAGGIAGGFISKTGNGLATALWIAAAIKHGIAIGWSLWKPKQAVQL